jgi:hypothetical protein
MAPALRSMQLPSQSHAWDTQSRDVRFRESAHRSGIGTCQMLVCVAPSTYSASACPKTMTRSAGRALRM